MNHFLDTYPQFFEPVRQGKKTFEVRNNIDGFNTGDRVTLQEFDPKKIKANSIKEKLKGDGTIGAYTGRTLTFDIGYVLPVSADLVVFSLNKILITIDTEEKENV